MFFFLLCSFVNTSKKKSVLVYEEISTELKEKPSVSPCVQTYVNLLSVRISLSSFHHDRLKEFEAIRQM